MTGGKQARITLFKESHNLGSRKSNDYSDFGEIMICPSCKAKIAENVKYCPYCNSEIDSTALSGHGAFGKVSLIIAVFAAVCVFLIFAIIISTGYSAFVFISVFSIVLFILSITQ